MSYFVVWHPNKRQLPFISRKEEYEDEDRN